jgi:hypothetical protein
MSNFPNRRWLVIPTTEVENVDFNQVHENSPETLRYSVDGTKTFIKYEVNIVENDITNTFINPETMEEVTSTIVAGIYGRPSIYNGTYSEYNHEEILELLATEEWTRPIDENSPSAPSQPE